jgi:prepilin-type N-terminal cleavage/methylation domain-containing protein
MFKKFSASLPASKLAGFTMIELLIVITILGILAVAVLSAINPLEQINRGRDTATRSDAEQIYNAIDRFNAFQSHFPWDLNKTVASSALDWTLIDNDSFVDTDDCSVLAKLSSGEDFNSNCPDDSGTDEIKPAFASRIDGLGTTRGLYAYKADETGSTSLYICFLPQSKAYTNEARLRCEDEGGTLPSDFPTEDACGGVDVADRTGPYYICLP